jgi:hypothetical protein
LKGLRGASDIGKIQYGNINEAHERMKSMGAKATELSRLIERKD